jgi:hypothetical protein
MTPKLECVNIVKTLTISAKGRATYAKMFYNIRQTMLLKYHTSRKIIINHKDFNEKCYSQAVK